jgi:two-component system response regulator GlrR
VSRRETKPVGHTFTPPTPVALRVLGSGREVALPFELERFSIGSDPNNQLVLDDDTVSGVHCVLERQGPHRMVLRDRRSTNGTFVNGLRVTESVVPPGARIVLGHTSLAVVGKEPTGAAAQLEQLVGEAPSFKAAIEQALRVARSSGPVFVQGESGTGKELFARLVHDASPRASGPFVAVNCGAITPSLVESELFGHEKGSFTGALARRLGVFEQADGGTLFLDEIGELPWRQQPKLLRVLETRRVVRVGGVGEQPFDVRVIAATHRNVRAMIDAGEFRLDLYHRLAGLPLRLPPLRERPEDLRLLLRRFLDELAPLHGQRQIGEATIEAMCEYPWPGNVRELRLAVQSAVALSEDVIELRHLLPDFARQVDALNVPARRAAVAGDGELLLPENLRVDDVMRQVIAKALTRYGSQRQAAQALGMSRSTLHERAHKYGLVLPRAVSPHVARRKRRPEEDDDGEDV